MMWRATLVFPDASRPQISLILPYEVQRKPFTTAVMTPHFFATKPKLEIKSSNIGSLVKYKALSTHYGCNAKFSSRNTPEYS